LKAKEPGFSLIEVLVALVILAVVMLSVAQLCQHSIRFAYRMRDHLDATWIAQNALTELQLGLTALPSDSGSQTNDETMDNTVWRWQATSSPSNTPRILKINITVMKKNDPLFKFHYSGYAMENKS